MRRADRLFGIIQILRRASRPLSADAIASELETSKWTIYRDIAALIGQRVPIRGEAGVGYVLEHGFDMPPLMLTSDEIEALFLGTQWVAAHADPDLARAGRDVFAKIAAIVPASLRGTVDDPAVGTPPLRVDICDDGVDIAKLRAWSRHGRKLVIRYADAKGQLSERRIWPFLIGYGETTHALIAWCELRRDFRIFRTDRLRTVTYLDERYPALRTTLRRRWLALDEAKQR